ncbi:MAG: helix-turn-helix domain-containing protein [Kiritimatiellae bacterium]|nr:helix-turn-helix domain-containing protein [Kiritimatiellia bacterium]
MQYPDIPHIHLLDAALWSAARLPRSRELTPLFIDRYRGPRQYLEASHHDYWELTGVLSGEGVLRCGADMALEPGALCLVPPGLAHCERSEGDMDTVWVGLRGSHLRTGDASNAVRVNNLPLAKKVEQLWLFAVKRAGTIGPELDALTAEIVAGFFRLLSEGAEAPAASDALTRAILLFQRDFSQRLTIAAAARHSGYSAGHFCRAFRQRTGLAPAVYLTAVRLRHARRLLEYTDLPISQVAEQAGYDDQLYFSRVFRKATGAAPTAYRARVRQKPAWSENPNVQRRTLNSQR